MKKLAFIGSAFGYGAPISSTSFAPKYIKEEYNIVHRLKDCFIESYWHDIVEVKDISQDYIQGKGKNYNAVLKHNKKLNLIVKNFLKDTNFVFPIIIGGDHSCAIGSWSGIIEALDANEQYGLIWIDAHMDAHTLETSHSKFYHGMPISFLLGQNTENFQRLSKVRVQPDNLVIIGVRSFEEEEEKLLNSLKVRVFYIDEVRTKGLDKVFREAISIVNENTKCFGVSIDLDAIDPKDAPGVGTPEPNGLSWLELKDNLSIIFSNSKLSALEITEFNPEMDINNKTSEIILQISIILGKCLFKI